MRFLTFVMATAFIFAATISTAQDDATEAAIPIVRMGDVTDPNRPMVRALWIDSWNPGILTKEQCDELVATARAANLNAIFPEVRKVGDAYYTGGLEPRASNIPNADFDPLQYLIDICHDTSDGKQYVEVHAWLVTFRIWKTNLGDPPPGHLLHEHPDAVMATVTGATAGSGSQFADPGHPAVQEWTVKVYRDIAERYDIDGIHHDYVRYPEYDDDWGYNAVSLERFRERTGYWGTPTGDDPRWQAWRRRQVLDVVRRIYAEVKEVNPDCVVSAATLNWGLEVDPWAWYESTPLRKAQQDWPTMMAEGSLDMNSIMNYARHQTQPHRFPDYTSLAIQTRNDRHAIIGVGIYMNTVDDSLEQIRMALNAGADGINIYDYSNPEDQAEFYTRVKEEVFTEKAEIPVRPWIETPRYGLIVGRVTTSGGSWADGATVVLDGTTSTLTDGTGHFAFLRAEPGTHHLRITGPKGAGSAEGTIEVTSGQASRQDVVLK